MKKYLVLFYCIVFTFDIVAQTITPAGPLTICSSGGTLLTASNGDSYQWNLNGSPISGATGKTYNANSSGTYTVNITTGGNTATSPGVVVTTQTITPTITIPSGTLCSGTPIQLNSSVTGGTAPYTYYWSFGDGGSSTHPNPLYKFNITGCGGAVNTQAALTVTDANGCSGTIIRTISILPAPDIQLSDQNVFSPFSNCENNPNPGNPNYTITVNNISPGNGCVTGNYTLDWGDGSAPETGLTMASFPRSHTYTSLGAFNLTLTATGSNGCQNVKTYVVANQSNPDIGIATTGITEGCSDLPVNIVVSYWQSNSPGTTYLLEYGDGTTKEMTHPINPSNIDEVINYTYKTSSCETRGRPDYLLVISATNACRTKRFEGGNIIVKTKPRPDFLVTTSPACTGQAVCFANTSVEGFYNNCSRLTQYEWDFGDPASGALNTSTAVNPCHNYSAPGTYTVTLRTINPCGSQEITKTVCVSASTTGDFSINKEDICAGETISTTNSTSPGTCGSAGYLWSVNYTPDFCGTSPSWDFASGSGTSSNPSFIFHNPGTYTISLSLSGGCGSGITQKTVRVRQKPVVTLDPIDNACGQAVITPIADIRGCSNNATYLWEFDGGTSGTSTDANPGAITFSTPGIHTISLAVTNECGTTTATQQFSNNTGADLTVPTSVTVCGGDNTGAFNFTANPANAPITWTNDQPSIGIAASGTGNIPSFIATNNTTAPITATITVIATINNCPNTKTFTITVNPKPATPVVITPVNYCHNDPATPLSATILPGHQLRWYNTVTGGVANSVLPTPTTNTIGTVVYYISQFNPTTNCESDRVSVTVNVSKIPVVSGSNFTDPTSCATATGTITLNGLDPSYNYSVRYIKDGGAPTTISLTSNASGNIVISGLTAGVYADIVVINNGCLSNISGPFTLQDPNPPPAPTPGANVAICEGTPLSLSASSGLSGISWNWAGPDGFTSNQQNPVINNAQPINSGNYSVSITLNNCTSPSAQVNAIVYPRPAAPTVDPVASTCLKSNLELFASTSFAGGVSWNWTGPNGFTSTQQNPVISNTTAATAGNYQVTVTSDAGSCVSPPSATTVSIIPIPVISSVSFINPIGCGAATGIIVLNGLLPSTDYIVDYVRNGSAQLGLTYRSAPDGTILVTGLRSGTYTDVTVKLNGCTSDKAGPLHLDDTPAFSVIAETNGELCEGSTLSLSARATASGAATYYWTGPNGFTSTLQNPVIPNAGIQHAGTYEVSITINGCTGKSSVTASIAANTIGGFTSAGASVCPGQNNGTITLSGYHGRVLRWEYSVNNGQSWNPIINTSASLHYTNLTATTWYRTSVQSGVCAAAYSTNTIISVLEGVTTTRMEPMLIETCNHDTTVVFTASAINQGTGPLKYYWHINGNIEGTTNPFSYNFHSPLSNPSDEVFDVYVVAENNDGCNERSPSGSVIIHSVPAPDIIISPSPLQREPHFTFTFRDNSPEGPSDVYTWDLGDTTTPQRAGREITYQYKNTGTFKVSLYVEDKSTGCNAIDSVMVTVVPVPGSLYVPNAFYPGSNHPELKTFKLKGTGIKKYRLQIFDAWGKVVFETTELNADGSPKVAWNGKYMNTGQLLPQDAYTWKIVEIEFENGKPWSGMSYDGGRPKYFGNVTLFR